MKQEKNIRAISCLLACLVSMSLVFQAQAGPLEGDTLDVAGDGAVGTGTGKGNLTITGKTGGSATPGLTVTGDGGVLFQGTFGTGLIPTTGSGTRFMWYPKKAALRAGTVTSSQWDDTNIGDYSVAFGYKTTASGYASVAMGEYTTASGSNSFAMGLYSQATGTTSAAIGSDAYAFGFRSIALGKSSTASGQYALVMGSWSTASGDYSIALGDSSTASATHAMAFGGYMPIASGNYSTASGYKVTAASAYSFALGRYNAVSGNSTTWVDTDPLFVIGNGTGVVSDPADVKNRNALTVLKNGKVNVYGSSGSTPAIVLDPLTPQITVGNQTMLTANSTSGYVGIGTSAPSRMLTVYNPTEGANQQMRLGYSDSYNWEIGRNNTSGNFSFIENNGGSSNARVTIANGGNVGIGVTAPTAKLQVAGETGGSASPGLAVTGDGGVLFQGTFGTGLIPATGNGTRFMWYPKKAALRAGTVTSSQWDDTNIGDYSVAFGYKTTASGYASVAMGEYTTASGSNSFAMGLYSQATGTTSAAIGSDAYAFGFRSIALGKSSTASGQYALVMGSWSTASGDYSIALGDSSTASATHAMAFGGYMPIASGSYSTASGYKVTASSAYSFVVGRHNAVSGNATTWVDTDPLFVVGNGTGVVSDPADVKNRNAFTVYKNGDVEVGGKLKIQPQGDLSMGVFTD